MEKVVKTQLAILNLAGELSEELANYFARKEIYVIEPGDEKDFSEWTHILTRNQQDFKELKDKYSNAKIISLSDVEDLQSFVKSNGKLVLDESWLKSSIGDLILDKFFQEYGGLSLEDNYPVFEERGSFNVTNPFSTGEYLDRLVHSAFKDGISGLSIKTFFDHLLMYLTGLKSHGKMGMPIEVMYGYFDNVFAVQLHFYTKNLIIDDVTSGLSKNISKESEQYLLNIAVKSSDFFDLTLLTDVNKAVVTGLWTKDERIQTINRGMFISELSATARLTNYPTKGVTSFQKESDEITDFSEKIVLHTNQVEDNFQQTVKGNETTEEQQVQIIHGTDLEEEIINVIKGNFKDEEAVFKISGGKFDVDKFAYRVSAGIEDKTKGTDVLKIKSLTNELPEAIKSNFTIFASSLNKSLDQITDEDLDFFKNNDIPRIIKENAKKVDQQVFRIPGTPVEQELKTIVSNSPLEGTLSSLESENEMLKSKMKTLLTEVKILKDSKAQMALIQIKASEASAAQHGLSLQQAITAKTEQDLKSQIIEKIIAQQSLNSEDSQKLSELILSENKLVANAKENEKNLKKIQIEFAQKETMFYQEMEKLSRTIRAKDLIVLKTKESLTKLVQQKDNAIAALNTRLSQANEVIQASHSQNQGQQIRDLEKQVLNQEKMLEIYKTKMIQKPTSEIDDTALKDENKRLTMTNNQMKNQIEASRKELSKYQDRMAQDSKAMNILKVESAKLEQQLKKLLLDEAKREGVISLANQEQEKELKKLKAQQDQFINDIKQSQVRQKDLEGKLAEALKNQKKTEVQVSPAQARGKTAHLENNVRKLTQDLAESRGQTVEMKKETVKLRQEKTAMQTQLDQLKKDLEKLKDAAPKDSGTPGKAA